MYTSKNSSSISENIVEHFRNTPQFRGESFRDILSISSDVWSITDKSKKRSICHKQNIFLNHSKPNNIFLIKNIYVTCFTGTNRCTCVDCVLVIYGVLRRMRIRKQYTIIAQY